LLDFFKCEAGYLVLNETEFEVATLLEECAAMVKALVVSHGLTLRVTVDRTNRRFVADRPRVRQILLNLLINAIKFTPRGGRISVRAHGNRDGGLILSVSDTGIGMGPAEIARALTPFGQINNGMTAEIAGAGLGLPFAMRLAELHGGRLDIESELNLGSKVIVRLPAQQPATTRKDLSSRQTG
jgi:signal transduction histidine kinase